MKGPHKENIWICIIFLFLAAWRPKCWGKYRGFILISLWQRWQKVLTIRSPNETNVAFKTHILCTLYSYVQMSTSIRCWYRQWSQLTIVGFVQNHFTGSSDILGPIQTLICTKRIPLKKISPHYHYQDALLIEFVSITVIRVWSNQTPSTPFELGSLWMTSLWTDVNWAPSN